MSNSKKWWMFSFGAFRIHNWYGCATGYRQANDLQKTKCYRNAKRVLKNIAMNKSSNGNHNQQQLLTELRQVNERLLESERLKSNFLSNIRNEIVNPLTSILGLSSSLANNSREAWMFYLSSCNTLWLKSFMAFHSGIK